MIESIYIFLQERFYLHSIYSYSSKIFQVQARRISKIVATEETGCEDHCRRGS